ncbi:MAG: nitroreductase/quinone reductase family protein [Acidimicrobiales bacterium]|nr:nitroreductase/quinone reductase family protein [Acidimicrobiales bacterium]
MATLSGRIVNIMSKRLPGLGRWATRRQVEQFRSSKGEKGNELRGMPCFLLDVAGRTSGEPRPVMLMLARRDDDLIVIGSNGGNPATPNWYRNLQAAGEAHVEVGADRWAVDFREVDGEDRDECWAIAVDVYPDFDSYQELTERRIPVGVLTPKA